jgi:hypothetical protein
MIHLQVGQTSIREQLGEKAETGRATKAQIVSLVRVFIKEGTFCARGRPVSVAIKPESAVNNLSDDGIDRHLASVVVD